MFHTIRAIGGRFLRDTRGGAAAIAAAGIIVMTLGGGALIIDHNHLVGQRDILKSAADAASLAATLRLNSLPDTLSDDDMRDSVQSFARKYAELNVLGNVNDPDMTAEDVAITFDMDRDLMTVNTTVAADTGNTLISSWLYGYAGPGRVVTAAGVESVETTLEVVLAIDVSFSMERDLDGANVGHADPNSRMSIVKQAAIEMVNVLQPSADSGVAVGVVPWDLWIRLDPALRATWTTNNWATFPRTRYYGGAYECWPTGTCIPPSVTERMPGVSPTWQGCLDEQRISGDLADITDETRWFDHPSYQAFAQAIYPAEYGVSYNCLDRPLPADFRRQECYGPPGRGHSPHVRSGKDAQRRCGSDKPSILPLSTEQRDIVDYIDELTPGGSNTHSGLGLLWGQRLLTPEWRDAWGDNAHPVDHDANVRKAIVLLTDGEDTQCGQVDTDCSVTRLGYDRADVCDAVKDSGSEIFVVAAMAPDKVSGDFGVALTDCSSQGDYPGTYAFLDNSDSTDLREAFTKIATQLRSVRRIF